MILFVDVIVVDEVNVSEREVTGLAIELTLPLAIDIGLCNLYNVAFLSVKQLYKFSNFSYKCSHNYF